MVPSIVALAAMVGSVFVAAPAGALTPAQIPADPAAWAASPYSPLAWAELRPTPPVSFTFDGEAGKLIDKSGVGIGFTAVLPSSAASSTPYYDPANLQVSGGKLNVLAGKGIATGTSNSGDDGVGVGIATGSDAVNLSTTFTLPAGLSGYAQGGLWLGPDDKNFIKLAVVANGTSGRQIQLAIERADVSKAPVSPATTTADQIIVATSQTALGTSPIKLSLTLDPASATVSGTYQIGAAAAVNMGSLSGVPASFFDGSKVAGAKPSTSDIGTFGGLFATKRNMADTTPVTFGFDSFGLTRGTIAAIAADATPPAAATALTATSGNASVALAWTKSTSADTAGYRVYRGIQPGVSTSGTPVSGSALVTGATFTDSSAANGTTYYYVVVAQDGAGNRSGPSNEVIAAPRVPNTTNVKVDFTKTNGTPVSGYLADWGQAYGTRTGSTQGAGTKSYGWITTEGNLASLVGNGRDRNRAGIPPLLDSIIHMQYGDVRGGTGTAGVQTEGVWELKVPNGLYQVKLAVGDSSPYDSIHVVNVEKATGIERFVGTTSGEYSTITTTVGVWDGKLTLSAKGGKNTKLAYVEVTGLRIAPHVDTVLPENRLVGHSTTAGVSATIKTEFAGVGVAPASLAGNVNLYNVATGAKVATTVGTSGGNDVISLSSTTALAANTAYRFVVGSGVTDGRGTPFKPFTSVFTTGGGGTTGSAGFTPATNIAFEKIELPTGAGKYWTSFAFGPDGKLYGSTIGTGIFRFTVNADGTLGAPVSLGHSGVNIIGLLFDKSATASNPKLWITSTTASFAEQGQWVSSVHLLSGPSLATDRTIFTGLPRSQADHLTNSMAYGPDGRIYFQQGSNQGAGDLDNAWGQRGEQLLTAATLVFNPADTKVVAAAGGGASINVQTAGGGTYNPYLSASPLKIYASGIRNAYDLVWHTNGHLYVATNGTAGGANTPGVTANADGTFTRQAADGIPGFSTVDGRDVTSQCTRRGYTGGTVAPTSNIATQRDLLFDVKPGKYYGHPNPERCEFVLNAGNNPATPTAPGTAESKYVSGQKADPNYGGVAFDFEFNKSPDGALEYTSSAFGGQLKGRLVITRFSQNNDLIFLQPDASTGKILGAQTSVGITGVANTTMIGVSGFLDPLEVVEDKRNGNLYVNQYDRGGTAQKLYLLRVPAGQRAAAVPAVAPAAASAPAEIAPAGLTSASLIAATPSVDDPAQPTAVQAEAVQPAAAVPTAADPVQVDFAPASAPVPSGWLAETGAAYSATTGYGWLLNGSPADRSSYLRYRSAAVSGIAYPSDPTLRTIMQMRSGTSSSTTYGVWEYALPNGTYRVTASVGDASYLDSVHGVAVEGVSVVSGFTPTGSTPFATGTKDVTVTDGKLTLTSTGTNTKLANLTIAGVSTTSPPAPSATGGKVSLRNEQATRVNGVPSPGLYEDWLVMNRVNSAPTDLRVTDSATVTVKNTGTTSLGISAITISGPNAADFRITTPSGTATVPVGASVPVTVKFVSTTGLRTVRSAQVNIASSDASAPTTVVQLRAIFGPKPGGVNEPSLNQLRQMWGWQTNVGDTVNGDEMRTSALNGDEVRSLLWKRADAALPVVARQIAAFHGCCTQTASIKLGGTTQAVHAGPWAQSVYPLQADGKPTELRVSPTTTFGITVSGHTTNNVNFMAVKTWPLKGRDGKVIPNAWIVGQDYISTPNQCGIAPTNCDFQDNVYVITNILPVAPNDTTAPSAPTLPKAVVSGGSVVVSWTGVSASGLGGYHVERANAAGGPWARLTNQAVSATTYRDSGLPLVNTLYYRVLSTDSSGNVSAPTSAVSVAVSALPRTMLIKAGGPTTTVNGRTFLTDTAVVTGGRLYTNPRISDIFGTVDDGLYWSERSDAVTFAYNIPIASGSYTVKLHFAEPYFGATGGGAGGVGKRVFDVNYEDGAKEIVGLDLNAKVPPMTAYIDSRTVTVVGGNLDIDFAATTNFPSISAIEIIPN